MCIRDRAFTAFSVVAISRYDRCRNDRYDGRIRVERETDERVGRITCTDSGPAFAIQPVISESDDDRLAARIALSLIHI